MAAPKTKLTQSNLTRYLKAWKVTWGSERGCKVCTDDSAILLPSNNDDIGPDIEVATPEIMEIALKISTAEGFIK